MPNRRMAKARPTRLQQGPCGIIPVTALWPLCRYRHKGHWAGHHTRLDRDQSGRFKTKSYAREELVAELCAAFTCASLDISPTVRHADYVGSWLEVLNKDKRAIFRAASQASKAADFLLAFEHEESSEAIGQEEAA